MLRFFLETYFIVIFVVNTFEAAKPFIRSNTAFPVNQIYKNAVRALGNSLKSKSSFLFKSLWITEFIFEIINTMKELASLSIKTVTLVLILSAKFCLVVGRQMGFSHQLIIIMSIRAILPIFAIPLSYHVSTHFCFFHFLNLHAEFCSLFFWFDWILSPILIYYFWLIINLLFIFLLMVIILFKFEFLLFIFDIRI